MNILSSKIDIKAGKLTFGQRIDLGKILQDGGSEVEIFERIFLCLHHHKPTPSEYGKLIGYFGEIIEGIRFWSEQESTLLAYEPSAEEIQAGIRDLSKKIGEYGTVKTLAKNYAQDPDTVLGWEYAKVFGILYTDLEEYKFQQKYSKVIENKYKK